MTGPANVVVYDVKTSGTVEYFFNVLKLTPVPGEPAEITPHDRMILWASKSEEAKQVLEDIVAEKVLGARALKKIQGGIIKRTYIKIKLYLKKDDILHNLDRTDAVIQSIENNLRWNSFFLQALKTARTEKCIIADELLAMEYVVSKMSSAEINSLPAEDIIEISRLSSRIIEFADGPIKENTPISVSGESNELLYRVSEFSGFKLSDIISDMRNNSSLTV